MKNSGKKKIDPIKKPPLRDPGQSLREERDDFLYDRVMTWLVAGIFVVVLAGLEWYRWIFNVGLSSLAFTAVAILFLVLVAWRIWAARKQLANLKLGLKGERAIGQFLQNELLPRGYTVIHDICADDFNIDHVAIGPGGVFAIETKTHSKPGRGDRRVTYDGAKILVDGREPERNPVIQARAAAGALKEILLENSGHEVAVRPVVLFPGWFVEKQPTGVEVWVLNEKALVAFLDKENQKLPTEQQRVLTEGLARYVRDRESK